jgi:putative ATP-dependent endonuclease of the OLD family
VPFRLSGTCKVVLVEGPSDRLIFASLIDRATERFKDNRAVEVIEVGGKTNFAGYQKLLDALKTPWTVVADRDYIEEVGSRAAQECFEVDASSQAEAVIFGGIYLYSLTCVGAARGG